MILPYRKSISNTILKRRISILSHLKYSTALSPLSLKGSVVTRSGKTSTLIHNLRDKKKVPYDYLKAQITQLLTQKKASQLYQVATALEEANYPSSYELCEMLMKGCCILDGTDSTSLSIRIYLEAVNLPQEQRKPSFLVKKESETLLYHLLISFQHCKDFTNLLTLRLIWENNSSGCTDSESLQVLYHSAFIHTFLNTNQNQLALELFEEQLHVINEKADNKFKLLKLLPIVRVLDILSSNKDSSKLLNILRIVTEIQKKNSTQGNIINDQHLIKYLNTALSTNDFNLTEYIYDNYIMYGLENSALTSENVLFEASYKRNAFFNSINDTLIYEILNIFVTKGDVKRTLGLIESHHIHKTLKGERALNKDLCVNIIESYCYHPNLHDDWDYSEYTNMVKRDESIKRVLDVLESFVIKLEKENVFLGYKDLSSSFSYKFLNYKAHDKVIEKAKLMREDILNRIINSEENAIHTTVLPRKVVNFNLRSSESGNSLANLEVLTSFISEHVQYLKSKSFSDKTITLFINCALNHVNLYQNFSATVRILLALNKANPNFISDWLNQDLYNIISNTLSNSTGGKICSLYLFKFLKNEGELTHHHYSCLLSANIRGNIHHNLQYFIYNYLRDFKGEINYSVLALLRDIPPKVVDINSGSLVAISLIKRLYERPENLDESKIDLLWEENKLHKSPNFDLEEPATEFNRKYNHIIDRRDSEYLKYVLNL